MVALRTRKEPPPLRVVRVADRSVATPRLLRLTFEGDELCDMPEPGPAASVRLLIPSSDSDLVIPMWNGNEFLLPDGERPLIRTFTPLHHDPANGRLQLDIVRHPGGAVSTWAESAEIGSEVALSGPGRAHEIDADARRYVLLGDETALPAISQLLRQLPADVSVEVYAETVSPDARVELPDHPSASVLWSEKDADASPGHTLVAAVRSIELDAQTHVWAAGEAASMQAIRKDLFGERDLPRGQATIRGYWKPAR